MKITIFLLLAAISFDTYCQQEATLDDGTKIVRYPDKTWHYEKEVKSKVLQQPDSNKITINIDRYTYVYEHPTKEGAKLEGFPEQDLEVLDYSNNFFKVRSTDGRIGYVIEFDVDGIQNIKDKLTNRIAAKAFSEGKNLIIKDVTVEDINSANGVDFSVGWLFTNPHKTIKYIYFTVVPYNQVGDIQICEITGHSNFVGKVTGPINAESGYQKSYWSTAWYNNTISFIKLTRVEVQYLDGSNYIYIKEIPKILDKNFKNSCK